MGEPHMVNLQVAVQRVLIRENSTQKKQLPVGTSPKSFLWWWLLYFPFPPGALVATVGFLFLCPPPLDWAAPFRSHRSYMQPHSSGRPWDTVLKPPSHHFCESLKHPRYSNISPLRLLLTSRSVSGILLQSNLDCPNKVTLYWTCPEPRNCLCFISPLKRQKPDMGGWGQEQHTVPLELWPQVARWLPEWGRARCPGWCSWLCALVGMQAFQRSDWFLPLKAGVEGL